MLYSGSVHDVNCFFLQKLPTTVVLAASPAINATKPVFALNVFSDSVVLVAADLAPLTSTVWTRPVQRAIQPTFVSVCWFLHHSTCILLIPTILKTVFTSAPATIFPPRSVARKARDCDKCVLDVFTYRLC